MKLLAPYIFGLTFAYMVAQFDAYYVNTLLQQVLDLFGGR